MSPNGALTVVRHGKLRGMALRAVMVVVVVVGIGLLLADRCSPPHVHNVARLLKCHLSHEEIDRYIVASATIRPE